MMIQARRDLNSIVTRAAKDFGFDQVAITLPEHLKEGEQAIQRWVQDGRHGDMKYMELFHERQARFFKEFPQARSVIVLGINYYSKDSLREKTGAFSGRVARYAWGKDYHAVIRKRHEALMGRLKNEIGESFLARSCVDIQPVPERFGAVQAGLGFIGKHTGLLNQKFGPWLFLSEIVTNLDLKPDLPASGDCGTCNHCQKACPTGALDKDYQMDARRCIAYLTIEHKGMIPRDIRPFMKDWIFGCDDCLNVCPFGSKSEDTQWPELKAEAGTGSYLNMEILFSLSSNSQFEKQFKDTALLRITRKQMLRNACIVLGNSGDPAAVQYLKKAIQDPSSLVRAHAVWALAQLGFPEALKILAVHRKSEKDPDVLEELKIAFTFQEDSR